MIQTVFTIFGLLCFIDVYFEKKGMWDKLENVICTFAEKIESRIIYKIGQCQFCKRFWITVILTLIYFCINGGSWEMIIVPFITFGIHAEIFKNYDYKMR